jgi:hypothetical protein
VQVRSDDGPSGVLAVLALLLTGWLIILRRRGDQQEYGKDKIYTLPLAVCRQCRSTLRDQRAIKEALCQVPEYRQLLDKFPDARVIVRDVRV